MIARLILENAGGGSHFLASGRLLPDHYRFERVAGKEHLVALDIPGTKIEEVSRDMLSLYGMPDTIVAMILIPEEGDAAGAAEEVMNKLREESQAVKSQILAANAEIESLRKQLAEAVAPKATTEAEAGRLTDDQLAMLGERDQMLELLKPLAEEMETPLDVVIRLTGKVPESLATAAEPSEPDPQTAVETLSEEDLPNGVPSVPPPNEAARRAELSKLGKKKLRALVDAANIEGGATIESREDMIEAILMHEAAAPAAA